MFEYGVPLWRGGTMLCIIEYAYSLSVLHEVMLVYYLYGLPARTAYYYRCFYFQLLLAPIV